MPAATGESGIDLEQLEEIEKRFDKFKISVAPDLTIRGSVHQGFAVNTFTCDEMGQGGGGPTPEPGACCLPDGTCEVVTLGQCLLDGGTFQGGGTDCDTTGACCMGSDCIITTEECCSNAGGVYQGNGTTCDPNPCGAMTICPCFFDLYTDGITCYTTLTIDGSISGTDCGGSHFSNPVDCSTRFRTQTCVNTPCTPGWTGSCTTISRIDDDCNLIQISCVGTIFNEFGIPVAGCGMIPGCDCDSAVVGTLNVSTLSEECLPP